MPDARKARERNSPLRTTAVQRPSPVGRRLSTSLVILLLVTGCGLWSRRVKVGEEFTLRPGEKVVIAGTDLAIQLKGVGHQWYVDRRADSPYAELIVSGGGASARPLTLSESTIVGDYSVKLVAGNPFRDNGGPDCKLIVMRK